MSRPQVPPETQSQVLFRARRRCALCFAYEFVTLTTRGQIAHIDHDANNNDPKNLVFLCLDHHDEYDSKTSQSKGMKPAELITARAELDNFVAKSLASLSPEAETSSEDEFESSSEDEPTVMIDVYNARIPIYRAYRLLYAKIMRDAAVQLPDLFTFAQDTNEALFLFGEEMANYLNEVYKKGVDLWASGRKMEDPSRYTEDEWSRIVDENTAIVLWFSNGFSDARIKFLKYLRLE